MHEPRRLNICSRSTKRARHQSRERRNLDDLYAVLEVGVRRSLKENPDEVILIEGEYGVQRTTLRQMFDDFQALKVCVG